MSGSGGGSALAGLTSPEVERRATVLVPVGSLEQHGPHLPLDTDTVVATAVAERLAALLVDQEGARERVLVAPALAYGASGEHQSFAGTTSIGGAALRLCVVELVRSVRTWAGRVVLVNGHGGNLATLVDAVGQLVAEGHDVAWVPCAVDGADAHAGRTETSLMLHLRPDVVRQDRLEAGNTAPLRSLMPALREGGVAAVSVNGVLGDPRRASAAEGAAVLEEMARLALARVAAVAA